MLMIRHKIPMEQRQVIRRNLHNDISFFYHNQRGCLEWYFGSIINVSQDGIQIKTQRKISLEKKQQITLLCFVTSGKDEQNGSALKICGEVAWCNKTTQCFGLRYLKNDIQRKQPVKSWPPAMGG